MKKDTGYTKDSGKDLLSSQVAFENLHDAIFCIDSHAQIFRVNEMACSMTGYSKEELVKKTVSDINPTTLLQDFDSFWKRLKKEKKIVFSTTPFLIVFAGQRTATAIIIGKIRIAFSPPINSY